MTERKLARVVTVDGLSPIEGADRIELALIGGWQVIVQKGLYTVGCKAVYFEIDSLLSTEKFPDLAKMSSKLMHEVQGVTYCRIKTLKLKGEISQGYLNPLSAVGVGADVEVDTDLTEFLGVRKYESKEERVRNNGEMNVSRPKTFPDFIPKTDQTRVQNMSALYLKAVEDQEQFEVTYKLDGSSLTAWSCPKRGDGVASRNVGFNYEPQKRSLFQMLKHFFKQVEKKGFMNAKMERVIPGDINAFTDMAREARLIESIRDDGRALAIQGEMVGPSIQKNFEGVKKNTFYCYDIYMIDEKRYMLPQERVDFCQKYGILHVPTLYRGQLRDKTVKEVIASASGPSGINGKYREGLVYKSEQRDFSFKVISNEYLLKEK